MSKMSMSRAEALRGDGRNPEGRATMRNPAITHWNGRRGSMFVGGAFSPRAAVGSVSEGP